MRTLKFFALPFICFGLSACWSIREGEKVGVPVNLTRQGFFCKTYEAEIVRGGLNAGSDVNGAAFSFTIEDPALADQLRKASESQQEVKVHYHKEFASFCRSDSENYFLDSFEIVDRQPK